MPSTHIDSRGLVGHRIVKRKGNTATIAHEDACMWQCGIVINPSSHPWVTYTPFNGELECDRCKVQIILPCPATIKKGRAYLALEAIGNELDAFRGRHAGCLVSDSSLKVQA